MEVEGSANCDESRWIGGAFSSSWEACLLCLFLSLVAWTIFDHGSSIFEQVASGIPFFIEMVRSWEKIKGIGPNQGDFDRWMDAMKESHYSRVSRRDKRVDLVKIGACESIFQIGNISSSQLESKFESTRIRINLDSSLSLLRSKLSFKILKSGLRRFQKGFWGF